MLVDVESRSVSPVFVGRGRELAELSRGLGLAGRHEPQAFVIGGEAGVGKTRLLDEFLAGARAAGAVTAVGGCVELGADGLPFAPFAAALRALYRHFGAELTEAAAGREGELAGLLPELAGAGRPAGDVPDRARLFELTARILERLAAERPVVVAVEDLHWADRSTRELLGYLVRSVRGARLLLLATYRSDDIHRRHPLRPFLAELDRLRAVGRIELARFSHGEVSAQLAGILGAPPKPGHALSVFERSEGNPFFVEELATGRPGGALSQTLRDLLLVRVEALSEDVQEVLRVAAEAGASVEYALLRAVVGLPEPELLTALRAAVGAHLLAPTDDGDGYRFRHALVREAVADDLLPGERARLARRLAEALERGRGLVPDDELATRLASHWYHAGDRAKALPAVLDAAAQAYQRYAYAEQLRLLERAMELWDAVPEEARAGLRPVGPLWGYPADPAGAGPLSYVDLLAEATRSAVFSGQPDRTLAMSKRALRLIDERREPLRAAWFWLQRAWVSEGLGRGDGWPELVRAQELVRGLPPSFVPAQVLALTASWRSVGRRSPEVIELAERAVAMARLVGAESTERYARITLACLRTDAGEGEEGLAEMFHLLDRILECREISLLGRCLVNLQSALGILGDFKRAVDFVDTALRLVDRYGLQEPRGWLLSNHAHALVQTGRWREAASTVAAAERQSMNISPRTFAALTGGQLAALRGDLAEAKAQVALARGEITTPDLRPSFVLQLGTVELEIAAVERRFEAGREAFRVATAPGLLSFTSGLAWLLVLTAARGEAECRGLPAAERERAAALARVREVMGSLARTTPVWAAAGAFADAQLRRAEGRDTPEQWASVVAALEPLTLPYYLAEARYCWAESLLAEGGAAGRERAAEALRPALETARELQARPLEERARRLVARGRLDLAAPEPERATAGAAGGGASFGLTPRERDVLVLVAAGRSNRQIAEELFISPKTASVHVSHILAKLEVSGRGEAAALAHRPGIVGVQRDATPAA
ncbi:hypothetical protein DEH69_13320 [Streptomyces sp. PT12]|nr:hypothetical protein DEH69_13320 [Streptomyces sp. PT12]